MSGTAPVGQVQEFLVAIQAEALQRLAELAGLERVHGRRPRLARIVEEVLEHDAAVRPERRPESGHERLVVDRAPTRRSAR